MPDLRPYQEEAVAFLTKAERAILAYAPGTGKTATIAGWLAPLSGPLLVVAPNGPVLAHWRNELERWGDIDAVVGTGSRTQRTNKRDVAAHDFMGMHTLILNYECMRQDVDELLKIDWDAVVFDESHRLKNRKSLVFKAAGKLARRTPRVALVTGTPILNSADELWTSLHMLEPTKYRSFWRWADLFFEVVNVRHRGRAVREIGPLKPGSAISLRKQMGGRLIQRPMSDLMPDLPAVTETSLHVTLSAAERKMYETMVKHFWMEHSGALTVAPNKISQSLRLRQLASDWSAFTTLNNEATCSRLGAKGKAAVDIVNDLAPEQVLVFCAFRHTVDALVQQLHGEAVPYHGGHTAEGRARAIDDFRHGRRRILVGTIATLGEGIDGMQVARNAIFVDRDWTPSRNEQAIARLARSGQRSAVNVIHLIADDTIDQTVSSALSRKASVIRAIMEDH